MWRSSQTRWKRSAEAAISVARFEGERRNLARCLAGRLLNPRQQGMPGSAPGYSLQERARYETAIAGLLDDFSVRLSLAAKQLQTLCESAASSEYEDAGPVSAEADWTRAYYEALFECPIPVNPEWDAARVPAERRSRSFDEFMGTLEATIAPHLHSALDSAA